MKLTPTIIIADGGNSSHLPDHTLESCLSAYTAGADHLLLTVQSTSDGVLVLFRHVDLSEQTDIKGSVESLDWASVSQADAGAVFSVGNDNPWQKSPKLHRFIRPVALEDLLLRLEDNVDYLLQPGRPEQPIEQRHTIAQAIETLFGDYARQIPTLVVENVDQAVALQSLLQGRLKVIAKSDIDPAQFTISTDVTTFRETNGGLVTTIKEDWSGKIIDTRRWVAGVSSGHHIMRPMLGIEEYSEKVFCASAYADNGLHIDVIEGTTYASAGVVSQFSLDKEFVVDVDFTYDNPAIANMMVLAVINQDVFPAYYHHEGGWENPVMHWQNHAFDTHGAAPFVSMEREEGDGFRIMKYTSNAGVYEWYGNWYLGDVGNGASKQGRLRLERRGRFFSGYYQDENNGEWVGVGTLENASMNERVNLRLGAKHYLKQGAPDPLERLHVHYTNLLVRRPPGAVYQIRCARNSPYEVVDSGPTPHIPISPLPKNK